ncbi:hypothetical protein QOT17_025338 [Balamuthia mandrillaris]
MAALKKKLSRNTSFMEQSSRDKRRVSEDLTLEASGAKSNSKDLKKLKKKLEELIEANSDLQRMNKDQEKKCEKLKTKYEQRIRALEERNEELEKRQGELQQSLHHLEETNLDLEQRGRKLEEEYVVLKQAYEAELAKKEEVVDRSHKFASWLSGWWHGGSPSSSPTSSSFLKSAPEWGPLRPKNPKPLIALDLLTPNISFANLAEDLAQALSNEGDVEILPLEKTDPHMQKPLVLVVIFSGGARVFNPGKVKDRLVELKKLSFHQVGVCILRYGDKESTIQGESPTDPIFYEETSVAGEPFSIFLQTFKEHLFSPSKVNEQSFTLLQRALQRINA